MSKVSNAIGSRFERIIIENFPELKYIADREHEKPDFEHDDFYFEVKTAYYKSSIELTQKQLEKFSKLEKSVIYLMGFHNFENSLKRLSRCNNKNYIRRKLNSEMDVYKFYFVNIEIMKSIFSKHKQNRNNSTSSTGYFQEVHFHQIFENRQIKRGGIEHLARQYYKINDEKLVFERDIEFANKKISYILDPQKDKKILNYINSLTIPF